MLVCVLVNLKIEHRMSEIAKASCIVVKSRTVTSLGSWSHMKVAGPGTALGSVVNAIEYSMR